MRLSFIHLYQEAVHSCLDISVLASYLREQTGLEVDLRGDIIPANSNILKAIAMELAKAKIIDPRREKLNSNPLPAEIEYETRLILTQKPSGLLYDGFCLQEIFRKLLPGGEHNLKHTHIIFTSRLFGTFEGNRYHARVAVFGHPSLISTTGIVEAPAKPRKFYLRKQFGEDLPKLKEEFKGKFIDYDDPRMTEVMKGYVMQAFFYHIFGYPFCDDPQCRLYNSHWQEEVIRAQIESEYEFCQKHRSGLSNLNLGVGIFLKFTL